MKDVYVLVLNNMRGRSEDNQIVAETDTLEEMENLIKAELTEPYDDKGFNCFYPHNDYTYHKTFRKGGPFEWCNPPLGKHTGIFKLNSDGVTPV